MNRKLNIVSVEAPEGGYTGWLRDKPGVIVEGKDYVELVQNMIETFEIFSETEDELKK